MVLLMFLISLILMLMLLEGLAETHLFLFFTLFIFYVQPVSDVVVK